MNTRLKNTGFTIIEVLIVLAIAALILLIALLAIPQLQRNVRNHQRKRQAELFLAELETARSHNGGKYPGAQYKFYHQFHGAAEDWSNRYVNNNENFIEPLGGEKYTINWGPSISGLGHIDWVWGAWCDGDVLSSSTDAIGGDRSKVAVVIGLEPGDLSDNTYGNGNDYWLPTDSFAPADATYCVDNSED